MDATHLFAGAIAALVTYSQHETLENAIGFIVGRRTKHEKAGDKDVAFWQMDLRDSFREVQNQTLVPLLQQQNDILMDQTKLLTKAVTILEIESRK